jgi:agmatine deiminase
MNQMPAAQGFQQPSEWDAHRACWLAFPYNESEWGEPLAAAQAEFVALCEAIAEVDPYTGEAQGEQIELLVANIAVLEQARHALASIPINFHLIPYNDIWLRDCAPIFVRNDRGAVAAVTFQFNAWGRKFDFPLDEQIALQIAKGTGLQMFEYPFVLEGGSVETDGEGTCLTTRQCLLNPNRNPDCDQATLEQYLKSALGYQKVLWLEDGLLNDHTDGHIDTIARYIAPGLVMCMAPQTADDPNAVVLERIAQTLATMTDAQGRSLKVVTIPSPGRVLDDDGQILPASYVNFYIGNRTVVVPTYGSPFDAVAVAAIAVHFPKHRTVGRSAKAILTAGGAFHCITQQEPRALPPQSDR